MAPKAAKRANATTASSTGPVKKPRLNPAHARVTEIIEQSTLPDAVSKMLVTLVPGCLGTCSDERTPIQVRVVEMLAEVVEEVTTAKKTTLAEAQARIDALVEGKDALAGKLAACETALKEADGVVSEETSALEARIAKAQAAKLALCEKQREQTNGEAKLAQWRTDKETYETVAAEHLVLLKDGSCEDADIHTRVNAIMKLAPGLGLDQALATVAPTALAKKPADRGSFDDIILQQLEKNFADKIDALTKAIDEAGPNCEKRAAETQDAQIQLRAAEESEASAKADSDSARAAQVAAASALREAKADVDEYEPRLKEATAHRSSASTNLDDFLGCHAAAFTELRDKVAAPVEAGSPGTCSKGAAMGEITSPVVVNAAGA